MSLKYNINKIHGDLLNSFENIKLEEKSSHRFGNHFEITASKDNLDVKMIISKRDIENETFKWHYYANPLKEGSDLVERVSTIFNLNDHVLDIVNGKRFNEEYINSVKK